MKNFFINLFKRYQEEPACEPLEKKKDLFEHDGWCDPVECHSGLEATMIVELFVRDFSKKENVVIQNTSDGLETLRSHIDTMITSPSFASLWSSPERALTLYYRADVVEGRSRSIKFIEIMLRDSRSQIPMAFIKPLFHIQNGELRWLVKVECLYSEQSSNTLFQEREAVRRAQRELDKEIEKKAKQSEKESAPERKNGYVSGSSLSSSDVLKRDIEELRAGRKAKETFSNSRNNTVSTKALREQVRNALKEYPTEGEINARELDEIAKNDRANKRSEKVWFFKGHYGQCGICLDYFNREDLIPAVGRRKKPFCKACNLIDMGEYMITQRDLGTKPEQHEHLRVQKMLDERYASMSSEEKAAKQKKADKMIARYLRKHPEYTQSA